MKYAVLLNMARLAYSSILRDLLVKAISDPDSDWDDLVLSALDHVFGYTNQG